MTSCTTSSVGTGRGWGRYTQADPLGIRASVNVYGYAAANPVGDVDPLGLWSLDKSCKGFEAPITAAMARAVARIAKCGVPCAESHDLLHQIMSF